MIDPAILKPEEKAVFALRSLYRSYGYGPYKMSKFEEYEYYIRNKDFLVSDRIITFNDTNGKLLALKPDVTLSIIKTGTDIPGCKQKVYYNENIYRVSESTRQYKEILQAGIECIGDIGPYDIFEVLSLAAGSLALMGPEFVLQISHLGLLSGVLDSICTDPDFQQEALSCISGKNTHDLQRLCAARGLGQEAFQKLSLLVSAYGPRQQVLQQLEAICGSLPAWQELKALSRLLDSTPHADRILFDLSVVNNRNYYSGILFRGFLSGVSGSILAGGQYDGLMRKMGRSSGAIGFAVYLDLLEQLPLQPRGCDVDVLLLYPEGTAPERIREKAEALVREGKTVTAQQSIPPKLRFREIIHMGEEDAPC